MKRTNFLIGVSAAVLACATANADVSVKGFRLGAKDIQAAQKFYEQVFGLREIIRVRVGELTEVVMAFGDSVESAKANPGPRVILMQRKSDVEGDGMPHMVFNISDMAAASAAVKAAGGSLEGTPKKENVGTIQLAVDPAGNHLEMILPSH
jgi:predicted enzyme related to lactoylglutathione lyase